MNVVFTPEGWEDLVNWSTTDSRVHARIVSLIDDIRRQPFKGLGKPEPLRGDLVGWWSRRITYEHRLVYRVAGAGGAQTVTVVQCRDHY